MQAEWLVRTHLGVSLDYGHAPCPVRLLGIRPEEVLLDILLLRFDNSRGGYRRLHDGGKSKEN